MEWHRGVMEYPKTGILISGKAMQVIAASVESAAEI
jgi:hypothetical protein